MPPCIPPPPPLKHKTFFFENATQLGLPHKDIKIKIEKGPETSNHDHSRQFGK